MADQQDLGSAYSGQDDINDKLLLDLAWERQQKKVGCASLVAGDLQACSAAKPICLFGGFWGGSDVSKVAS